MGLVELRKRAHTDERDHQKHQTPLRERRKSKFRTCEDRKAGCWTYSGKQPDQEGAVSDASGDWWEPAGIRKNNARCTTGLIFLVFTVPWKVNWISFFCFWWVALLTLERDFQRCLWLFKNTAACRSLVVRLELSSNLVYISHCEIKSTYL